MIHNLWLIIYNCKRAIYRKIYVFVCIKLLSLCERSNKLTQRFAFTELNFQNWSYCSRRLLTTCTSGIWRFLCLLMIKAILTVSSPGQRSKANRVCVFFFEKKLSSGEYPGVSCGRAIELQHFKHMNEKKDIMQLHWQCPEGTIGKYVWITQPKGIVLLRLYSTQ